MLGTIQAVVVRNNSVRVGIFVIRGGGNTRGWNGIQGKAGLSAKNVPARQLSMNVATIPPGGVAA